MTLVLPVVLFPKPVSTLKADRVRDVATQVVICHRVVARDLNRDVLVLDASAWASTTALKLGKDRTGGSADPIRDCDVADVELARVALAGGFVVAGALSDGEDARGVVELEVRHGDICSVTETSAASIWWVATADTGPGLEVSCVSHTIVNCDIADGDVLNPLEFAIVLPNAAHRKTEAGVPVLVLDENVGAVGFGRDVIVAAVNHPVAEGDVVGVDNIGAIGIQRGEVESNLLLRIRAVHIHVLQQDIFGMNDSHGPHLTLHEAGSLDNAVLHALERDLMRTARVVVGAVDKIIPDLAISVERTDIMARPMDVLTTEDPSGGLVLEANGQRVVEPVWDVGVPQEGAVDVDVYIGQAGGVHDTANIVCLVLLEDDSAAVLAGLMTTSTEGLFNGVRGVVGIRIDYAGLGAVGIVAAWRDVA